MEEKGRTNEEGAERAGEGEPLAQLFQAFLEGLDQGRDLSNELLARAGELRPALEAKIRLELELRTLSRDLGLGSKLPGAPQQLGRFHILELLGQGGISRVFLAHDPKLGRKIALKVLEREVLLDKDQRAWILNEARSLARLDHPHVVKVYEIGETETHAYVAMELLTGPSLQDVIREWARQRDGGDEQRAPAVQALAQRLAPFSARIELLAHLAEALAYCHDNGILHRDIKPQNVLFDAAGAAKLIDFGLAHVEGAEEDSRLGLTQALVGTAAYIAPEQVANDRTGADPRSDQFVFATLAYECFALENPFARRTRRATLDAIEAGEPPPLADKVPAIPPDLVLVLRHAHDVQPKARYAGMGALAADLRAILANRPVSVVSPTAWRVAQLWARRHRRGLRVASTVLALALATWGVVWSLNSYQQRQILRERLEAIHPARLQTQNEFFDAWDPLYELGQAAQAYEVGFLRRAIWGGISDEVMNVALTWSQRLGELYAADCAWREELGMPPPKGLYPELFVLDSILCRDSPYNAEARRRGTVLFSEELLAGCVEEFYMYSRVREAGSSNNFWAFRPTQRSGKLEAGTYRWLVWKAGTLEIFAEVVFFVPDGWPPAREIELRLPDPELLQRTRDVKSGQVDIKEGRVVDVPRFRMLDHLVTRAEFARFLQDTGTDFEWWRKSSGEPDDVAAVTHDAAMAFAAWFGGRLPTLHELRLGLDAAAFPDVHGELVLDMHLPTFGELDPSWYHYKGDPESPLNMASRSIVNTGRVGFRIVFAADEPRVYQRLAEQPVRKK